jgi:hypothetical protein
MYSVGDVVRVRSTEELEPYRDETTRGVYFTSQMFKDCGQFFEIEEVDEDEESEIIYRLEDGYWYLPEWICSPITKAGNAYVSKEL